MNKYDDLHDKYRHECGGSIINKYQILSAAHCFKESKNPQDWIVIAGRNDFYIPRLHKPKGRYKVTENLKNVFIPKDIILHGGYRKVGKVNDIAIINLKQPLKLTEKPIGSIELALKPPSKSDKCMVAGWGRIHKNFQNSRSYPFKINCQRDNFAGGFRKGSALSMISLKQPLKLMEKPIGSIKLALKPPSKSDKRMVAG